MKLTNYFVSSPKAILITSLLYIFAIAIVSYGNDLLRFDQTKDEDMFIIDDLDTTLHLATIFIEDHFDTQNVTQQPVRYIESEDTNCHLVYLDT